jgi:hypothetical protein
MTAATKSFFMLRLPQQKLSINIKCLNDGGTEAALAEPLAG